MKNNATSPLISKGVSYMLFAVFCFSIMNLLVKYVNHISAMQIILFRSAISLAISLTGLRMQGVKGWGNNKSILLLRGLFGGIALTCYFVTLQNIPLASAVTLYYLSPIFTAIIAWLILGERLRKIQWLFFLISFVGVTMVKGFDTRITLVYFITGLASAFFSGCAYNCIRKLKTTEHPLMIIMYFPLVTLPVSLAYCIFYEWTMPTGWDWVLLIGIGVLTQIAQFYMTKAYQIEQAAKVASASYSGMIYALGIGFFFFQETFNWVVMLGIVLMIVGVVLNVTYKKA